MAQVIERSRAQLVLAGESCAAVLKKAVSEISARQRPRILGLAQLARGRPIKSGTFVHLPPRRWRCRAIATARRPHGQRQNGAISRTTTPVGGAVNRPNNAKAPIMRSVWAMNQLASADFHALSC
jgi:hypothetical protein